MKKFLIVIMAALILMPLASSALAAGGDGPPKDMLKGVFTQVDDASHTAVFKHDRTGELQTLTLGQEMTAKDVRLNKKVMVGLDKHAGEGVIKDISVMFMDMTPGKIIALIVVGLIGGLLSGFIGSGGAFVLTPAMMSLGVPGAVAVASNMCHKFPKAMVGTYKRWKYGQVDLKLAVTMAVTAMIGVQIGIKIQKYILNQWGNAGSNLYVSTVFVIILILVGGYVFYDAKKLAKGSNDSGNETSKLALAMQKINLPPMMHFKVANVRISAWVTIPVGLATGMLAATIAVGGFIGVPGMIYVIGASAVVASATELGIAFVMGAWGSIQWGLSGLIDIRLTLLILSASLIGVQLGALGTTYVKDYTIKIVMGSVMLIVAISRGAKIPGYLVDLGWSAPLSSTMKWILNQVSFWALVAALAFAGIIITVAMIQGMSKAKNEAAAKEAVHHG
jgi:hypothetical protein